MLTTRIFAVRIRVANSETPTTRIFAVKIRVANFEMQTTWIFEVKIRVASFWNAHNSEFCGKNSSCWFWNRTTRISAMKSELQILKCKPVKKVYWCPDMNHGHTVRSGISSALWAFIFYLEKSRKFISIWLENLAANPKSKCKGVTHPLPPG